VNNTCPSCGATYNITAAMIGREVVCKKCNSELTITEAGIELKDAPPPPPRRGSGAFNVGSASPASPSRRPVVPVQEEAAGREYDDEDEAPAPRDKGRYGKSGGVRSRRSSSGGDAGGFADFASFRTLITPTVIVVIFWILAGLALIGGLLAAGYAFMNGAMMGGVMGMAYAIIGPFVIRLYCEIVIVAFRIYSTLLDILAELKSQR